MVKKVIAVLTASVFMLSVFPLVSAETQDKNITIKFENTLNTSISKIIKVTKIWEDTEAQKDKRPENIKIQIKNDDNVVREKTVSNTI